MREFFYSIWLFLQSVFLWFGNKENRQIGIKYTYMGLKIFRFVSQRTKNTIDDKACIFLFKMFNKALELNNLSYSNGILREDNIVSKVADDITNINKGILKPVSVSLQSTLGQEPILSMGINGHQVNFSTVPKSI